MRDIRPQRKKQRQTQKDLEETFEAAKNMFDFIEALLFGDAVTGILGTHEENSNRRNEKSEEKGLFIFKKMKGTPRHFYLSTSDKINYRNQLKNAIKSTKLRINSRKYFK